MTSKLTFIKKCEESCEAPPPGRSIKALRELEKWSERYQATSIFQWNELG